MYFVVVNKQVERMVDLSYLTSLPCV